MNLTGNPVIVSLSILTLIATAITATATISGYWDENHTTEAELQVVKNEIDAVKVASQCSNLDLKIALTEQAIWQMEQSRQSSERLTEKKRELRQMESLYEQLNCASFLKI